MSKKSQFLKWGLPLDEPARRAYGHGLWPWPGAMAWGHGLWPWPGAMALGHGLGPWPWAMAMAMALGRCKILLCTKISKSVCASEAK